MTHMPFHASGAAGARRGGKTPPPEETFEEAAYLKNLGEKQRSVSIKLADGEIIRGWIEYYDRRMIRLTREGAPNLFIYKHEIAYIAEESARLPEGEPTRASRTKKADLTTLDVDGNE